MSRTRSQVLVTVLFVVTSASQLHQFPREAFGDDGLPALAAFHAASGLSSLMTAIGTWRGVRRSWVFALLWGAITTGLVLSLPRLLRLSPEESAGMPLGAGVIVALAIAAAVYLHRALDRER